MSFSNLEQLYRQVIMDHYKNPRNKGLLQQDGYHEVHLKIQPVEMTSQFKLKLKMEKSSIYVMKELDVLFVVHQLLLCLKH